MTKTRQFADTQIYRNVALHFDAKAARLSSANYECSVAVTRLIEMPVGF
jgi:hypothetical protein